MKREVQGIQITSPINKIRIIYFPIETVLCLPNLFPYNITIYITFCLSWSLCFGMEDSTQYRKYFIVAVTRVERKILKHVQIMKLFFFGLTSEQNFEKIMVRRIDGILPSSFS